MSRGPKCIISDCWKFNLWEVQQQTGIFHIFKSRFQRMSLVINTLQVIGNENSTGQLCYPVKDAILLASAPHKFDFMCETYRQEQATG
jgi:hypothetical protein